MQELPPMGSCIGIWGFGRVGKSIAQVLIGRGYQIAVMDSNSKVLSDNFLQQYRVPCFTQDNHDDFFHTCSSVIPSPGIDIRPCNTHGHAWISELDLFQALWQHPIIAVTGSVGKTTIASMLAAICNHNGIKVALGGNIGTAMHTLLEQQADVHYALLEVSSFQLEHCRYFSPSIAIITNLHENHLDRHDSYDAYWQAKANVFSRSTMPISLIAPWTLRQRIQKAIHPAQYIKRYYVAADALQKEIVMEMDTVETLYTYATEKMMIREEGGSYQTYITPSALVERTFLSNALTIMASMDAITNNNLSCISFDVDYTPYEHRLEQVAVCNGITFINDSKATTIVSTLAAVHKYNKQSIILIIGGLSKGINRRTLIQQLPLYVMYVICFGAEASQLATWCQEHQKQALVCATLDQAFVHIQSIVREGMVVLFSPSGSSYDLYKNYEERGAHFKQLVHAYMGKGF